MGKIQSFESTVLKVEKLTPTVKNIHLSIPTNFTFKAGQFVTLFFNIDGKEIRRLYSIASPPNYSHIELCIKRIEKGMVSNLLHKIKEGDKIKVLGPAGHFTLENKKDKDLVLISTGAGIAPFRSMINELLKSKFNKKIILLTGFRYENEVLYREELEKLSQKHPNLMYKITITRPGEDYQGTIGRVPELIKKINIKDKIFFLCGLYEMIKDVKDFLISLGVSEENIHFERWD